jgi:hypothetical protein
MGLQDYIGNDLKDDFRHLGCALNLYCNTAARFPYVTNIIVKSGQITGYEGNMNTVCPALEAMELYGGHVANKDGAVSVTNLTIGGKMFFIAHNLADWPATISVSDNLWVDFGAVKAADGDTVVEPSVKYGGITFAPGVKVAIKDWSKLPKGRRVVALNLSETTLSGKDTLTIVESDEGTVQWDADEQMLYARRHADGMFLIFR